MGCAGRVANGINTVHLSYVREKTGHALIGARQWIPEEQVKDSVKSLVTGLPPDLRFRTKGQLAIDVLTEGYADGLAFDEGAQPIPRGDGPGAQAEFQKRQFGVICLARQRCPRWPR